MTSQELYKVLSKEWPELEGEIENTGFDWEISHYDSFYLYEEAQYRHLYWKPYHSKRVPSESRLYFVYLPALRYIFSVYHRPYPLLAFSRVEFIRSTDGENRNKRIQYALPNGGCTGDLNVQYSKTNSIEDILSNFWSSGFNLDLFLGPFFHNVHYLNEVTRIGRDGRPLPATSRKLASYELFEKWERLTPKEVMLCATHFGRSEDLLSKRKEIVNHA